MLKFKGLGDAAFSHHCTHCTCKVWTEERWAPGLETTSPRMHSFLRTGAAGTTRPAGQPACGDSRVSARDWGWGRTVGADLAGAEGDPGRYYEVAAERVRRMRQQAPRREEE